MTDESGLPGMITRHSKVVIVVLLLLTVGVGSGMVVEGVDQSSSLDQFESDTPEARALEYADSNFSVGNQNTTTVQIIVRDRDGNVLSKSSLLSSLRYQQQIRANQQINATLAENNSVVGIGNIVATAAIRLDQASELQKLAQDLQQRQQELQDRQQSLEEERQELQRRSAQLNATARTLSESLNRTREIQKEYTRLNLSLAAGNISQSTYEQRQQQIRSQFSSVRTTATANLSATQAQQWGQAFTQVKQLQSQLTRLNVSLARGEINMTQYREQAAQIGSQFEQVYQLGTRGVLAEQYQALQEQGQQLQQRGEELREDFEDLQASFQDLQERQKELQSAPSPTLQQQIDKLESMNDSEVESVVTTVLSDGDSGGSNGSAAPGAEFAFRLMPTSYEPGSATATSRMIFITQKVEDTGAVQGPSGPGEEIIDAQLAMQDIGDGQDQEYIVFGFGLISDEINQSLSDSVLLVGPLAMIFVLLTLIIAYRDVIDILLGFVGILAVLVWTFGFMAWLDINFNQIMIAVPVLLIGLSIDYAIHIFMRHREQRYATDEGPRGSMRVALAGVGIALVWVTATTVIGFLSNLISPLGPIRDFGIVSSLGIVAALIVFGALIPALKIELDGLLEGWGLNRKKRAFGTGGGYFSKALSVGAIAARKAPAVVIVLALVVTAFGAAGGSQVSTSFQQEDFLAEDPPGWMDELPEPFRPAEYSAKQHLEFVSENFQREDSQSQVLVRADGGGSVATASALEAFAQAEQQAANSDVTFVLSNGEPSLRTPLTVMEDVAATNESFNATFQAADTDGDGVPDQDVTAVFDALFEIAPDQARDVVQQTDSGEYAAARMVISVKGSATTAEVTSATRGFSDAFGGTGLEATATGSPVVNEVVQNDLFETVVESLIISLVAVFVFLMIAYRITEGSATLGVFTLLPVALAVAWILGTMFLIGVPFNVITGTITSLTIGLGVAYSIHVSERYNLELERQGNVKDALQTAVTGTGGALLGSAATTVGGFGTLAIAIFPALQQFGIITGLTIVYSFFGSVLVLPSLLVVWTHFIGPDVPRTPDEMDDPDERGPTGAAVTEDSAESSTDATAGQTDVVTNGEGQQESQADATDDATTGPDPSPETSTESGAGELPGDGTDDPGEDDETPVPGPGPETDRDPDLSAGPDAEPQRGGVPGPTPGPAGPDDASDDGASMVAGTGPVAGGAGPGDADYLSPSPTRSVLPEHPSPGQRFAVTVSAENCEGRVLLVEEIPSVGGTVQSIVPEPETYAQVGHSLYVLWALDDPREVSLEYTLAIPEEYSAGDRLAFDGSMETADGEFPVGGRTAVYVTGGFMRRALENGVDVGDLEVARQKVRDGELDPRQLRWLYRRWLEGSEPATPGFPSADGETPPLATDFGDGSDGDDSDDGDGDDAGESADDGDGDDAGEPADDEDGDDAGEPADDEDGDDAERSGETRDAGTPGSEDEGEPANERRQEGSE